MVEYLAPAQDQRFHFLVIEHPLAVVGFPLVPEGSLETVLQNWVDHGVVDCQWCLVNNLSLVVLAGKTI